MMVFSITESTSMNSNAQRYMCHDFFFAWPCSKLLTEKKKDKIINRISQFAKHINTLP